MGASPRRGPGYPLQVLASFRRLRAFRFYPLRAPVVLTYPHPGTALRYFRPVLNYSHYIPVLQALTFVGPVYFRLVLGNMVRTYLLCARYNEQRHTP